MMRVLIFLMFCNIGYSQVAASYVVPIKYKFASTNPFQITLSWNYTNNTSSVIVYRKKFDTSAWSKLATLTANDTIYTDNGFFPGFKYEYMIQKTINSVAVYGNIAVGENIPPVHNRGYCLLVCDSGLQSRIPTYLDRHKTDLIKDGYIVNSIVSNPLQSPLIVKNKIMQWYQSHPSNSNHSVFLVGKVPIPYSGNLNPDAHPEHKGAWPADGFYADMDNDVWDDASVNTSFNSTPPNRIENVNSPGDGKFDNSYFPTLLKVQIGRVYLDSLSSMGVSADSLYKRYFDKLYKFKNGLVKVPRKACIEDRLGLLGGEIPGRNVFQNAYALVGKDSTVVASSNYLTLIRNNKFLFAQASSTGGYTQNVGIASSPQVKDSMNAIFQGYFGSYFGDWDNNNNFLRSAIAGDGINLTSVWAGRPQWYFHHMSLGNTIGFSTLETQNNFVSGRNLYFPGVTGEGQVHIALMGDPTLHLHIVSPPSALLISKQDSNRNVKLTWTASTDPIVNYYIYRADSLLGKFNLKDSVNGSTMSYLDTTPKIGKSYYLIKACKMETSINGSYNNLSLGIFASIDSVVAKPKIIIPSNLLSQSASFKFIFNSTEKTIQIEENDIDFFQVKIIDLQGKSIENFVLNNREIKSLSYLVPGGYLIHIIGNGKELYQKIIIE